MVLGYSDDGRWFKFANSWGSTWGDEGYGYLPYDYWESYSTESWCSTGLGEFHFVRPIGSKPNEWVEHTWTLRAVHGLGYQHGWIVYDPETNLEIAWAFAVDRSDSFDVEELYVRERFRRRGIARVLARQLVDFGYILNRPARFWLSHFDSATLGPSRLDLAAGLGLRVEESGVPWAAKVLVDQSEGPLNTEESPAAFRPVQVAGASMILFTEKGRALATHDGAEVVPIRAPCTPDSEAYDLGRNA